MSRRNTTVICFANNKGGSGKSTSCANLGSALSRAGKRVLLIDGDMQLNLSLSFFDEERVLEYAQGERNLYEALVHGSALAPLILQSGAERPDVIVSSMRMSGIETKLPAKRRRELVLRELLRPVRESGEYDYILIDAPPTLGDWVTNILLASDRVIIPVEATPWGLFGLANMMDFLHKIQSMDPTVQVLGILVTKVDERKNYYHQTMETLAGLDDVPVFRQVIHVDSAVEWAQDASMTVIEYRRSGRSAKEYMELAREVEALCQ
ncbi:ParA family protein [Lachnoclostridium sp. Marseille-P6806]|uniref:ParA family protein n=1 Tax=Lachnoclostridium sp. Marseille-P6806 TaxID=2364793 RepID=UPI0010311C6B|nr:AAA family ATPase [Lachnoclostridium sp. Marseille-P6806]